MALRSRRPTFNRAKAQAEKDQRYRRALADQRDRLDAQEAADRAAAPGHEITAVWLDEGMDLPQHLPAAPPAPTHEG